MKIIEFTVNANVNVQIDLYKISCEATYNVAILEPNIQLGLVVLNEDYDPSEIGFYQYGQPGRWMSSLKAGRGIQTDKHLVLVEKGRILIFDILSEVGAFSSAEEEGPPFDADTTISIIYEDNKWILEICEYGQNPVSLSVSELEAKTMNLKRHDFWTWRKE